MSNSEKKQTLELTADAILPTADYGEFSIYIFKNIATDKEHVALTKGEIKGKSSVLCRVASECMPGTAFHYNGCECREQIDYALNKINNISNGIFIYLRQEGRGQGLTTKVRAMKNKNKGFDTFTAVEMLGVKADVREYWEAAEILKHFDIHSVRLLTNNPEKVKEIESLGIEVVERVSIEIAPTDQTRTHLEAKKKRGHVLHFKTKEGV